MKICSIINCGRYNYAFGYCQTHYLRSKKSRTKKEMNDPISDKSGGKKCMKCGKPIEARNLCHNHYHQWQRQDPVFRPKVLQRDRDYLKRNPKAGGGRDNLDLRLAMTRARLRDKDSCRWYGCKNTGKDGEIHVHHIFPKSEYPELALEMKYMICYCEDHHRLWHRKRFESGRTPRTMTL